MTRFEFHPRLFNPLYWHIREYLGNPDIRYIYVYGGSSAAKTYSLVQAFLIDQIENGGNIAVFRKESTTIDETVYQDYRTVISTFNLNPLYHCIKHRIRSRLGTKNVFKGMDDPEKAKGLSSFKYAYLNELTKFEYSDYDEITRRLRGMSGQKIIADWNPVSEDHWIKKQIVDTDSWRDLPLTIPGAPTRYSGLNPDHSFVRINEAGDSILIKTTYRDNYWIVGHPSGKGGFIDRHALNRFEKYRSTDGYTYSVYANGEWGHLKTGQEIFDKFNRQLHVKPVSYDPMFPLHISLDFNNLPYSTCLVMQRVQDGAVSRLRIIDEICLKPPGNTVVDIAREFEQRYPNVRELWYSGDPAGNARAQKKSQEEAESYFEQVRRSFSRYLHNYSDIVPDKAPPLAGRRYTMNSILTGAEDVVIEVSPRCENLISDFETLLIDNNGGYQKKKVRNDHGQSYEKGGHCMDALIYWINSQHPELFL